jgi:hypothetical protein
MRLLSTEPPVISDDRQHPQYYRKKERVPVPGGCTSREILGYLFTNNM